MKPPFDVVVVGAGSSGCVLAGKLCQKPDLSVCLVEAGPDYGPVDSGRWPPELLDPRRQPTTHDWGYVEERSYGLASLKTRAKVIGGCSVHNPCGAVWGQPEDYDEWANANNPGWSYAETRPLIDRIERTIGESATPYRGRDGLLPTRPFRDEELASWQRLFMESAIAAKFGRLVDLSAPDPAEGVAPFHANIKDSIRWNASFAFLDPVRDRPNLTIMANTLADRLTVIDGRASSIVCRSLSSGDVTEVEAQRFVLSAGTYSSPIILMRSGIGPAKHLRGLGVRPQVDLQGVGMNLHDHPGFGLVFEPSQNALEALENDLTTGRLYESQVILRARSAYCRAGFDLNLLPYQHLTEAGQWSFVILVFNMVPLSRGRVLPRGRDPGLPPRIEFNPLTDSKDRDQEVLMDGLHLGRRLANLNPLVNAIERENEPGETLHKENDLRAFILNNVRGFSHPVGTCKMGVSANPTAVVDPRGRVHGTDNIFVADASIMPKIPRAPINMTCFLIGLRIADQLLALEA